MDAEEAFGAHLNDFCVSFFGGKVKWCGVVVTYGVDTRSGRQESLEASDLVDVHWRSVLTWTISTCPCSAA